MTNILIRESRGIPETDTEENLMGRQCRDWNDMATNQKTSRNANSH